MISSIRSKIAVVCAVIILIVGMFLYWSSWKAGMIFAECHKLQQYTPETNAAYLNCMKDHGLNPEDWE